MLCVGDHVGEVGLELVEVAAKKLVVPVEQGYLCEGGRYEQGLVGA